MSEIKNVLSNIWGYQSFRVGQEDIINHILQKKSLLAVMPTGAGKSLCFQLPALLFKNQTIVISPLVSLMDDQVSSLKDIGVKAERVHSDMHEEDRNKIWKNFKQGEIKILYISPESLMRKSVVSELKLLNIEMFVVDEAHCISKWGSDFRKNYEELKELGKHFPNSIISAFTATADEETRLDINQKLTNGKGKVFLHGFNRPNLSLAVQQKYNWKEQLLEFLEGRENQAGIVYCLSRKDTENCATFLSSKGFNALSYHAGMEKKDKVIVQDKFMTDDNIVICATIAFGMGIDKANVRYVVHISLPGSMENFYQEIGRAGRDGLDSQTLLIFGLQDLFQRRKWIYDSEASEVFKIKEIKRLDSLIAYCESATCRKQTLLSYFRETCEPCEKCDNCINPPQMIEGTEYAQMVMSAIYRTGQSFGANHIIDILRGVCNPKIKQRGHDRIKTFGVGKTASKEFWINFIRQLVSSNNLRINIQRYGAIEITLNGEKVFKGEEEYFYKRIQENIPFIEKQFKKNIINNETFEEDKDLLISLKSIRLKLAKEKRVPAYIIFPDVTLHQMLLQKPKNLEEFGRLNGVGPQKLKKYGESFINILRKNRS